MKWHKQPTDAGRRPEMMGVGWAGMCAWQALLAINFANDFEGRIPAKYARPEFLACTNPEPLGHEDPYPRPDAKMMAYGIELLISAGLAKLLPDAVVELDSDTLNEWQAPRAMTSTERSRKHRSIACSEPKRNVPDATDCNEPLHATPVEQRREESEQNRVSRARRPQGKELVEELFAHHLALCEQAPAAALKRPSPIGTHHKISEAIHHPLIREASPEEIKRALDMLAVQAKAKADAGEADAWWPLRSAWSPNVLADGLSMPDAATARQRATKRSQGAQGGHNGKPRARSVPALTAADYRAMADQEDEQL